MEIGHNGESGASVVPPVEKEHIQGHESVQILHPKMVEKNVRGLGQKAESVCLKSVMLVRNLFCVLLVAMQDIF